MSDDKIKADARTKEINEIKTAISILEDQIRENQERINLKQALLNSYFNEIDYKHSQKKEIHLNENICDVDTTLKIITNLDNDLKQGITTTDIIDEYKQMGVNTYNRLIKYHIDKLLEKNLIYQNGKNGRSKLFKVKK